MMEEMASGDRVIDAALLSSDGGGGFGITEPGRRCRETFSYRFSLAAGDIINPGRGWGGGTRWWAGRQ